MRDGWRRCGPGGRILLASSCASGRMPGTRNWSGWPCWWTRSSPRPRRVDTIARHLPGGEVRAPMALRGPGPGPCVSVVSDHFELRETLAEACEVAGYLARPVRDLSEAAPGGLAVWDIPVLRTDWPRGLARRASAGPVVALLGFADRATVGQARAHGASACLELPFDLADLVFVLDRLAAPRIEPRTRCRPLPPPPRRGTGRDGTNAGRSDAPRRWPNRAPVSRMTNWPRRTSRVTDDPRHPTRPFGSGERLAWDEGTRGRRLEGRIAKR